MYNFKPDTAFSNARTFRPATIVYKYQKFKPYKIGQKIRIAFGGKKNGDFTTTFGRVVEVKEGNVPVVAYKDYSHLRLGDFNRIVNKWDVIMKGEFVKVQWKY